MSAKATSTPSTTPAAAAAIAAASSSLYSSWHWRRPYGRRTKLSLSCLSVLFCWLLVLVSFQDVGIQVADALHTVVRTEPRQDFFLPLLYDVGLLPGATIRLSLKSVNFTEPAIFVILTHSQWMQWISDPPKPLKKTASFPSEWKSYSSYLISSWRSPLCRDQPLNYTYHVTSSSAGHYYAGVLNVRRQPVRLQGYVEYQNPGGQHLKSQKVGMPGVLFVFTIAFFLLTIGVAAAVVPACGQSVASRLSVIPLHALLMFCLWLKTTELWLRWRYIDVQSVTGHAPLWHYQAHKLAGGMFHTSEMVFMLLTALGWRIIRTLTNTEWRIIAIGLGTAFSLVLLRECVRHSAISSGLVMNLTLIFYTIQVMCNLGVWLLLNLHIQVMTNMLNQGPLSPNTARIYHKHRIYTKLRRIFLAIMARPVAIASLRLCVFGVDSGEWTTCVFAESSLWILHASIVWTLAGPPRLAVLVHQQTSYQRNQNTAQLLGVEPPRRRLSEGGSSGGGDVGDNSPPLRRRSRRNGPWAPARPRLLALDPVDTEAGAAPVSDTESETPYVPLPGGEEAA
eukprot:CAMPEP_0206633910 /NCGR_PEP_ID=MMETSP0325_2-20121206/69746_1 /ASSEMBLY_ACC=CAM_ASM_000347 /TAXON_ID=2866 /ORGANISM="Crypthecodinium cohnii, Strain Seligo" /LENGTH=563 /DNA_ID=CAMNT_0054159643 /DNA_START=143 /DNA_END=1834 /DNA_ORIENTATION=-